MTTKTNITHSESDKFVLEMNREFPVAPETIFSAFSTFECMSQWFGPHGCTTAGGFVDFRVGGGYRLEIHTDEHGQNAVSGNYTKIEPPTLIEFSWRWDPREDISSEEMKVSLQFEAIGGTHTRIYLRQSRIPDHEVAEHHGWGWKETFERLEALFEEDRHSNPTP